MTSNIIQKVAHLVGAKFIAINNYVSSQSGEIANYIINVNISIKNAKEADLKRLQATNEKDLSDIAVSCGIALDTVKIAFSEMLTSAIKNLSANIEDRSNQSQGQSDAYTFVTPAIRFHLETQTFHIFGQSISKKVVEPGDYKTVNSSPKTLAKKAIKKHLNLSADKFRDFIIDNVNSVTVAGEVVHD